MIKQLSIKFINFFPPEWKEKLFSHGFKRYSKNLGWLFFGKFFGMLVAFFVGAYVARYLGPSQYGYLNYTVSFIGIFAPFASMGIDTILTRDLVKSIDKRNELLGTAFVIKFVASCFTILAIIAASYLFKNDNLNRILILTYSFVLLFQSLSVIDLYFQSQVLSKKTVNVQIFGIIFSSITKLVFIYFHLNVFWFVLAYLFDAIFLAAGLYISYRNCGLSLKWKFDSQIMKELLSESWPLILTSVAIFLYMKIDQVMIKQMMDETSVGLYSSIVRICEVWYFIPTMICASLFPAIVNAKKIDEAKFQSRQKKLYLLMFWLSVIFSLGVYFVGPWVLLLLFGQAYAPAIPALHLYTWASIPVFLGMPLGQYLIIEKLNKIYFFITFVGAVSNIILNIFLIPAMGITGAALATFISYFIVILSVGLFKKSRNQLSAMFKLF